MTLLVIQNTMFFFKHCSVMEYDGKVYTVRLVHGIGRFRLKAKNLKPLASKSSSLEYSDVILPLLNASVHQLSNHTSAETLLKIEQMIKPQHNHLENTRSKAHQHHSNSSSYTTRFIILFVVIALFCLYGYSEMPDQSQPKLSIKCAPPTEYVFVDDEVCLIFKKT
jgi:hypothetical protein